MRAAMRELLPTRRHSVTFDMKFGEHTADYTITLGFYDDGRLGEIFIDGGKSGSDIGAVTHDAAVLVSIGLQYGVPLGTMRHAMSRKGKKEEEEPATIMGAVLDKISSMEFQK